MPLKFRCYRCNQLLGASRSKVGTVISCPKCGSALVVPEPEEATMPVARSVKPVLGVLAAGGAQDTDSIIDIRPEDIRVEPGIEFLRGPAADEPELAEEPIDDENPSQPPEPALDSDRGGEPTPPPIVPPALPQGAPAIAVETNREARGYEPYGRVRARDVVLPRSVVLAWSLFVLLALALAFSAGLLAGHYVWRVHEPVSRLGVAPAPR